MNNIVKNITNWFIIQRIRLLNFIKEHKYISAGVGIFMFSILVGLIVYATNGDPYDGKVTTSVGNVTIDNLKENTDTSKVAYSFSTVQFNMPIQISASNEPDGNKNRNIVIKGTIADNIDAEFEQINLDSYEYSNNNKNVIYTLYDVQIGTTTTAAISVQLNNLPNNTNVPVNFEIYESTSVSKKVSVNKQIKINSTKVELTAVSDSDKIIPYLNKEGNGRYMPFAFMVGIPTNKLVTPNSLKGIYFDSNYSIRFDSMQNGELLDVTAKGIYDENYTHVFNMPTVFNSGNLVSGKEIEKVNACPATITQGDINADGNIDYNDILYVEVALEVGEFADIKISDSKTVIKACATAAADMGNKDKVIDRSDLEAVTNKVEEELYNSFRNKCSDKSKYLRGDINMDGKINLIDSSLLVNHLNNDPAITDSCSLANADYNQDGVIDNYDLIAITTIAEKAPTEGTCSTPKLGDVNQDGEITIVDAKAVLKYIVGLKNFNICEYQNADVNKDGKISVLDAKNILKHIAGLINLNGPDESMREQLITQLYDNPSSKPLSTMPDGSETKLIYSKHILQFLEKLDVEKMTDESLVTMKINNVDIEKTFKEWAYIYDANGDGDVTQEDAKYVLQTIVGLICNNSNSTPLGDANNDNVVTRKDFDAIIKYLNKQNVANFNNCKADMNGDGAVTIADAKLLLNKIEDRKITVHDQYKMNIENIKSNGTFYSSYGIANLGVYYIESNSIRKSSTDKNVIEVVNSIFNSDGTLKNKYTLRNKYYEPGKATYSLRVNPTEDISASTKYIAYGEETEISTEFKYKDGDDKLDYVESTIPLSKEFLLKMYSDGSIFKSTLSNLSVSFYINDEAKARSASELKTYMEANPNELIYINKVYYKATNVSTNSNFDFSILTELGVNSEKTSFDITATYTYKHNNDYLKDATSSPKQVETGTVTNKIYTTPFKARSNVFISLSDESDLQENDRLIDGAKNNTSLLAIYPTITMPSQLFDTLITGVTKIKTLTVKVTLPEGVNYVYNEEYALPKVSGKTLTYTVNNLKINEWVDPIYLDVNYDINIENNTDLVFKVVVDAESDNNLRDRSPESYRTTKRTVTYINSDKLPAALYSNKLSVPKETEFDITAKIYNNDESTKTNLNLIYLLPSNETSGENEKFNGSYTLSNIPSGAYCTDSHATLVNDAQKVLNNNEVKFVNCSEFAAGNYAGVTAVKISNINLAQRALYENKITIVPKNNEVGDKYQIGAFVINGSEVKKVKPITISVISKRITGFVWEDFDSDGIFDIIEGKETEERIPDISLSLYDAKTNELVKTVNTDSKGYYSINDIEVGTYYISPTFNSEKYGLSPNRTDISDKSIISSFTSVKNGEQSIIKTEDIEITDNTKTIKNVNLGLSLKKVYSVKMTKYISKVIATNPLGIETIRDYGKASFAKYDVKDTSNLKLKVVYGINLKNIGYYPGYIYKVKDYLPEGMSFNEKYKENEGWTFNEEENCYENNTLSNELIKSNEEKTLYIAFDIIKNEAGSYINMASVNDEDLQILVVSNE